jgi:hypothetical protein
VEQADFFRFSIETLERLNIPYMVVGSAASSIYGEPRMTQDLDVVIDATLAQLDRLCDAFPPDQFYVSKEAAHSALEARTQFNIIHPDSGNKIDIMITGQEEWAKTQFSRRRKIGLQPAVEAVAASPEDVIIAKMLYYAEGGSEKHLRDITGVLKVSGTELDRAYLQKWVDTLDLGEVWSAVQNKLSSQGL